METRLNMFETLLEQTLFQGMSRSDLEQVVGHTHFDFSNALPPDTIAQEGNRCLDLIFVTHGMMTAETLSDDHSYLLRESLSAPWTIEPERLFGLTQRYGRTYKAHSECRLFSIGKKEVVALSYNFEIFRINLLNIYTTQAQRLCRQPWRTPPKTIKAKLARFVADRSLRPVGEKTVSIKMSTFAQLLGESRLNISHALHELCEEGLIDISRGTLHISHLEQLTTTYP